MREIRGPLCYGAFCSCQKQELQGSLQRSDEVREGLVRELRGRLEETECDDAFLEDRTTGRAAQQTIWQLLAAYYSRACWDSD